MIIKDRATKKRFLGGLAPETAIKAGSVPSEYEHIAKVLGQGNQRLAVGMPDALQEGWWNLV